MSPARYRRMREVVSCLMCSNFYFELSAAERLALVRRLARDRGPEISAWLGASLPLARAYPLA